MRTENSVKNIASSVGMNLVLILTGFFTRKVFVDYVGVEYLGLNGLLSNILSVATLIEGGFAASVTYNLYKPLAEHDEPKILALLQLYKRVYQYMALAIFVIAMAFLPFLGNVIKGGDELQNVSLIYCIFLFNTLVGYFTAYKWTLIYTDQKQYKLTGIMLTNQLGQSVAKLGILYFTQSYIAYLLSEALLIVWLNWSMSRKVNKLYPYVLTSSTYKLDKEVQKGIWKNMKALFLQNLGNLVNQSAVNLVISTYIGIATVGIYSNYTLIINYITRIVGEFSGGFSSSIGNLIAAESGAKVYDVFRMLFFLNFVLTSATTILMGTCITPFIRWWLGDEYLLGMVAFVIILVQYYLGGNNRAVGAFMTKFGIFVPYKYTPLIGALLNAAFSFGLVHWWGLTGVFVGSLLSGLLTWFWYVPYITYRDGFKCSLASFYKMYLGYTGVALLALALAIGLCHYVRLDNMLLQSLSNGVLTLLCIAVVYFCAFCRADVFIGLRPYALSILKRKGKG